MLKSKIIKFLIWIATYFLSSFCDRKISASGNFALLAMKVNSDNIKNIVISSSNMNDKNQLEVNVKTLLGQ